MPVFLAIAAVLGGLAFWRRKQIGDEAKKLESTARQAVNEMRSGRKDLLVELGERVYAQSTGDAGPDNDDEISRLVGELVQIDAANKQEEAGEATDESEEPAADADAAV